MNEDNEFSPLKKGLMTFAVLLIIAESKVYAADILQRLSNTEFATGEGTLYPLLSRLKREELLQYEWAESESGPPRKYYGLTPKGTAYLADMKEYWKTINKTLADLGGNYA